MNGVLECFLNRLEESDLMSLPEILLQLKQEGLISQDVEEKLLELGLVGMFSSYACRACIYQLVLFRVPPGFCKLNSRLF